MKQTQQKIKDFCEENNIKAPIEHRVLDLVSEVGEVSKEVLKMSDYGSKESKFREEIKSELGDVLFVLSILATDLGVDLEEALDGVLEKYEKRLKKGSAGSENE
ncbi:MAG: nucleotide pyrophosphohydrolase [Parcubacteria group bacterium]|nr:nucleotide pyrophosphohydrolase [Parcubacteria group bacterium]